MSGWVSRKPPRAWIRPLLAIQRHFAGEGDAPSAPGGARCHEHGLFRVELRSDGCLAVISIDRSPLDGSGLKAVAVAGRFCSDSAGAQPMPVSSAPAKSLRHAGHACR